MRSLQPKLASKRRFSSAKPKGVSKRMFFKMASSLNLLKKKKTRHFGTCLFWYPFECLFNSIQRGVKRMGFKINFEILALWCLFVLAPGWVPPIFLRLEWGKNMPTAEISCDTSLASEFRRWRTTPNLKARKAISVFWPPFPLYTRAFSL